MLNLSLKTDRDKLEQMIAEDVEQYCVELYKNEHRNHLGASELGEPCYRMLYYKFRWFLKPQFDGRMLRLFNVGHEAEPRFIKYLRGIGFKVEEFSEDGKQFRISGVLGHYGGSLDAKVTAPERYMLDTALVLLGEFKTNNTGAGYAKVKTEDLSKSKPKHYAQMCQYGEKYGFKYGLYMIENKNDSEITFRIIELDWNYGKSLERKAEDIILAKEPPPRIAENKSFYNCKYCDFAGICHDGEQQEKNCRTCRQSTPVENGEWHCSRFNAVIPPEFVKKACDDWNPI